jgi:BlaI family transcriptional regulator, penicillinase repressor
MDTPQGLPPLSEAQLEIMNVVWDRGEVTVAEVWRALAVDRKVARNTVLTMLTRLEEKGWLERDSVEHAHRYRASVPREATLGTILSRLVQTAFGGSAEGLLVALLQDRGVSKEEAARIRAMIDQAEKRGRRRP